MNHHIPTEQWTAYIQGTLPAEERNGYDDHLSACDSCLERYMACLAKATGPVPSPDSLSFESIAQAVNAAVLTQEANQPRQTAENVPFYRQTLFHYAIAAGITVLLMSTGFFQQVVIHTSTWTSSASWKPETSVSERLVHKTSHLLQKLQQRDKGGSIRE